MIKWFNFYQYKMTQYNSLNEKLSNSQLNELKSAMKNKTEAVLGLSPNMVGNSNDETNFPHKLLLTNRQVANLRKAFENNLSTDIKLSKAQLSEMVQLGRFLGRLLGPLIPLGLTAATSAVDAAIHKKILGLGKTSTTTLIISNDEMEDIIRIVESLVDSSLLLKGVSEKIQNEAKEQKEGFLSMLLGTLGVSLLRNILPGKGIVRGGYGNKKGKGIVRACYGNKS